jgi:hypothetical protein
MTLDDLLVESATPMALMDSHVSIDRKKDPLLYSSFPRQKEP